MEYTTTQGSSGGNGSTNSTYAKTATITVDVNNVVIASSDPMLPTSMGWHAGADPIPLSVNFTSSCKTNKHVTADIYDGSQSLVKTLTKDVVASDGSASFTWDGTGNYNYPGMPPLPDGYYSAKFTVTGGGSYSGDGTDCNVSSYLSLGPLQTGCWTYGPFAVNYWISDSSKASFLVQYNFVATGTKAPKYGRVEVYSSSAKVYQYELKDTELTTGVHRFMMDIPVGMLTEEGKYWFRLVAKDDHALDYKDHHDRWMIPASCSCIYSAYTDPTLHAHLDWTSDYTTDPVTKTCSTSGDVGANTVLRLKLEKPPYYAMPSDPVIKEIRIHEDTAHYDDIVLTNKSFDGTRKISCGDPEPLASGLHPQLYHEEAWNTIPMHNGPHTITVKGEYQLDTLNPATASTNNFRGEPITVPFEKTIQVNVKNLLITSTTPANPEPIKWDPDENSADGIISNASVDLSCTVQSAYKSLCNVKLDICTSARVPVKTINQAAIVGPGETVIPITWAGEQDDINDQLAPKGIYVFRWIISNPIDQDCDKSVFSNISKTALEDVALDETTQQWSQKFKCIMNDTRIQNQGSLPAPGAYVAVYTPILEKSCEYPLVDSVFNSSSTDPMVWSSTDVFTHNYVDTGKYVFLAIAQENRPQSDRGHRSLYLWQMNQGAYKKKLAIAISGGHGRYYSHEGINWEQRGPQLPIKWRGTSFNYLGDDIVEDDLTWALSEHFRWKANSATWLDGKVLQLRPGLMNLGIRDVAPIDGSTISENDQESLWKDSPLGYRSLDMRVRKIKQTFIPVHPEENVYPIYIEFHLQPKGDLFHPSPNHVMYIYSSTADAKKDVITSNIVDAAKQIGDIIVENISQLTGQTSLKYSEDSNSEKQVVWMPSYDCVKTRVTCTTYVRIDVYHFSPFRLLPGRLI